nr:hypothetical protein [uncultured Roseococcus sp.]
MTTLLSITNLTRQADDVWLLSRPVVTAESLPNLEGSAKQVEWASKIRAQALDALAENIRRAVEKAANLQKLSLLTEEQASQFGAMAGKALAACAGAFAKADAGWWIDNRTPVTCPIRAGQTLMQAAR